MKLAKTLATVMAALVAAMGLVGVAAPALLLGFAQSLQSQGALYTVAAIRFIFGAILVWLASASRLPKTLRVIGVVIMLAAVGVALFGIERTQAMLDWFSSIDRSLMRAVAILPVAFGVFVIYAVNAPRRAGPGRRANCR